MRGHFPTRDSYLLNQAALFDKSNHYLKRLLERIAATGTLPRALPSLPYSAPLFRAPDTSQSLRYLFRTIHQKVRGTIDTFRGRADRWQVAFVRGDWRSAVLWRGIDIPNPPNHFLADPFVITVEGRDYCFLEDFSYATRRGSVAVYELHPHGAARIGTALEEPFHLSFPYLFRYGGELFMCPESAENRDIRIYRCLDFPLRWALQSIPMRDVDAVDTMIFEKDGRWWMFTNINPVEGGDRCSELLIFWAPCPISGPWTAHPLNPVLVDGSRARNAGLVTEGDRVFRVSQGQGYRVYGRRVLINEVLELSETGYAETCVTEITPAFRRGASGTHHLHSNGRVTAFDFVARAPTRS
jgi:hypothetical protein